MKLQKIAQEALLPVVAFAIGAVGGTQLAQPDPVPPLPDESETQLVQSAMGSKSMAADLKKLVIQVQQRSDWAAMDCDEMLPQFMQQWSHALGREAVRRGWKVGYVQGRHGLSASEAQFMALGQVSDPVKPTKDWETEAMRLQRELRVQGMELRRLERIQKQAEFRLPLNDNDGNIEKINLWVMGESIRDMMWHVIRPYLDQVDPEKAELAKEAMTRAIDSQGQAVTHDLIMAGWHYGYAAAQDTPVIWPQIQGVYREWATRYNAFVWTRPEAPRTDGPFEPKGDG